jgi:hypothetical protein
VTSAHFLPFQWARIGFVATAVLSPTAHALLAEIVATLASCPCTDRNALGWWPPAAPDGAAPAGTAVAPIATPAGTGNLLGVSISPSGRAWAVGQTLAPTEAEGTQTLILRWDGTAWH